MSEGLGGYEGQQHLEDEEGIAMSVRNEMKREG